QTSLLLPYTTLFRTHLCTFESVESDKRNQTISCHQPSSKNKQSRIIFDFRHQTQTTEIGNSDKANICHNNAQLKRQRSPNSFGNTGFDQHKKNRANHKTQKKTKRCTC